MLSIADLMQAFADAERAKQRHAAAQRCLEAARLAGDRAASRQWAVETREAKLRADVLTRWAEALLDREAVQH